MGQGKDGTCGLPLGYSMIPAVLKAHAPEYVSRAYGKWVSVAFPCDPL
jgi:hypothetical protein